MKYTVALRSQTQQNNNILENNEMEQNIKLKTKESVCLSIFSSSGRLHTWQLICWGTEETLSMDERFSESSNTGANYWQLHKFQKTTQITQMFGVKSCVLHLVAVIKPPKCQNVPTSFYVLQTFLL